MVDLGTLIMQGFFILDLRIISMKASRSPRHFSIGNSSRHKTNYSIDIL